jgi:hypothetical protein
LTAGAIVNLTREGEIDWVHWGLYTETSLDRKANVVPQIGDFTVLDSPAGFAFVYQFSDNATGYSWNDGTPTPGVTNTTTGVWAYGTPLIGSGFQMTAPADPATRTIKVYVGTFAARGRFEAFLSDGSARGYTNSSLFNSLGGPGGFYTITYAAASAGQELVMRWTLQMPSRPEGNVTLQAATLTSTTANNPPFVVLTSPANNASFAAASTITLSANASDLDGTVSNVEFYDGETLVGQDSSNPYSVQWNDVPAGLHTLTAVVTDSGGAVSASAPVEIFVNGNGGTLSGTLATPPGLPAAINLTAEGTRDWIHWGLATNEFVNRKAGVAQQISDLLPIGSEVVQRYDDNYSAFSWSDGAPMSFEAGTHTGVYIRGTTNGFELAVLADTTPRTLKIFLGLYGAQGNFQAWLSDFSATAYRDTSLSNFFDNAYGVYTITYAAASPGQYLTVRYRSLALFDQDFGNVTIQAATLAGGSVGNSPPSVTVVNPTNHTVLNAPASFTFSANASDGDGSVSQVEFFNGSTSLGIDNTSGYSVPVNNLAPGTYTLSAVATDNTGAKATNSVQNTVTNSSLLPVTLSNAGWAGADFVFTFLTQAGRSYEIQQTAALGGTWQKSGTLAGTGGTLTFTNKNAGGAQLFYRVETK